MAQINITLNQDEILQAFSDNSGEAFKMLIQENLNAILRAESAEQLKAEPYERTDGRKGRRNGTRERSLNTRVGTLTLKVPKHRDGVPFKTMVFDNYSRSEAALVTGMAEMVVNGVSTRKVSKIMEELCGTSYSKSAVSDACKELDKHVKEFLECPIEGNYPFVTIDATYFDVRENGRVNSKAFMIAIGTNSKGHNEILGFGIYRNESKDTWNDFLKGLKKRGLKGVLMFTSDAHEGIRNAIKNVFPEASWQRCQFHFSKDITEKVPKKEQAGLSSELRNMFNAETIEDARKKRDEIIAEYSDISESAMACLDEGFEFAMTVMSLPPQFRRYYRTSNHIERLNRELKRRSDVIGIFPNEASLERLMGTVLIEQNDRMSIKKAVFTEKKYLELMSSSSPAELKKVSASQS